MMKTLLAVIVMMAGTAFGQLPKGMTEQRVLDGLRLEAHKHGVRFKVFCVPDYGFHSDSYQADATLLSSPREAIYYEDGARDFWAENGATAIEAAYALYLDLANNHLPNIKVDHKPKKSDCHYNSVYDSEHRGRIPCNAKE